MTHDEIVAAIVKEMGHQEHVLRTMRLTGCSEQVAAVARARISGLRDALGIVDPDHPRRSKRKP